MHTMLGRALLALPAALTAASAAAVATVMLSLGVNYVALSGDAEPLLDAVRTAFADGSLPANYTIELDRRRGAFTYQDCLVLTMALERRGSALRNAVSPARLKPASGWQREDACATLRSAVVDGQLSGHEPAPYHRYVGAPVGLAALAVPRLGLDGYRTLLSALSYALCIALLAASALSLLAGNAASPRARRRRWAGAIVGTMFLLFSGMEFYAQNLSIGLADPWVYLLYATLVFVRPCAMSRAQMVTLAAIFFAAISAFEYWTGQLVLAFAGGIGLIGLDVDEPCDVPVARERTMDFVVAAVLTVVATFALKLGLASLVFDENAYGSFLRQLGARAGGVDYGIGGLLLHLGGRLGYVGQGSLTVGLSMAAASMLAGLAGLRLVLRTTPVGSVERSIAASLVASVMAVLAWHLVFRNQSTVHAHFMVRTLVWPAAAGWILLVVGMMARRGVAGAGA